MIAVELNHEAKRLGLDFGAAKASKDGNFTPDKCRIRWSYLHLKVSLLFGFSVVSESKELQSSMTKTKSMKPNKRLQIHQRKIQLRIIKQLLSSKFNLTYLRQNRKAR